uniref:Chromosome 6 open reading frame 163 n=1 Tax=Pseudonaja textilis TaxID=8673 RepID=A0A670YUF1_PSETE
MIRNPDFDTFVCCAVCSKLIPPPPTPETFDRIREYKPYKTRYYTHKDILGKSISSVTDDDFMYLTCSKESAYKNMNNSKDAVEEALNRAEVLHKQDIEELKKKHQQTLENTVKKTRAEMLQHLEMELKRESEAAEQRNTHKLQRLMLQLAMEKMTAVAEGRQDERCKAAIHLAKQEKKFLEQIHQAGVIANEIYQKNLQRLAWEKKHELEMAFMVSQKEFEEETRKLLENADNIREAQLEEVNTEVNKKESEILSLNQQLECMTAWKDSLEAEILEIREAFQKYINLTFPQLAPGQADFILPFRKISAFRDSGVELNKSTVQ